MKLLHPRKPQIRILNKNDMEMQCVIAASLIVLHLHCKNTKGGIVSHKEDKEKKHAIPQGMHAELPLLCTIT